MPYYEIEYSSPFVSREREVFMTSSISGISFKEKPKYGKWPFYEVELEVFSHSEARLKALRECVVVIKKEKDESDLSIWEANTNNPIPFSTIQDNDKLYSVRLKKGQILKLNKQSFYVLGSPSIQVKWLETTDFATASEAIEWGVMWNLATMSVIPLEIPLDRRK